MKFNTEDFLTDVKQFYRSLPTDMQQEFVAGLSGGTVSLVALVKAVRAYRKGNQNKAVFYALLWLGFTNNSAQAMTARYLKRVYDRQKAVMGVTNNYHEHTESLV